MVYENQCCNFQMSDEIIQANVADIRGQLRERPAGISILNF